MNNEYKMCGTFEQFFYSKTTWALVRTEDWSLGDAAMVIATGDDATELLQNCRNDIGRTVVLSSTSKWTFIYLRHCSVKNKFIEWFYTFISKNIKNANNNINTKQIRNVWYQKTIYEKHRGITSLIQ